MSKRQEIRKQQQQRQSRNRLIAILVIVAGAVLIAAILILPSLKTSDASTIIQITPVSRTAPVNKTSIGNPDAPVKMDTWEDFQCSGCVSYAAKLERQIFKAYVETGKLYYTFHFFPFIDRGAGESHQAANAAMCAAAQGRFWDYHDMLFANWKGENVGSFTDPRLVAFASGIGLDMTAFNQCFKANTYADQIQQDYDAGAKLGVPPTPGLFVNGKMVTSSAGQNYLPSFEDISKAIDAALGGAK